MKLQSLKSQKGAALILVLLFIATFILALAGMLTNAVHEKNAVIHNTRTQYAHYLALSAIPVAMNKIIAQARITADGFLPNIVTNYLPDQQYPLLYPPLFNDQHNYVHYLGLLYYSSPNNPTPPVPCVMFDGADIPGNCVFYFHLTDADGSTNYSNMYNLEIKEAYDTRYPDDKGSVHQSVYLHAKSLAGFAKFHQWKMSLTPPLNDSLTLGGRFHSNGNLYLDGNGGTLRLDSRRVSAVGNIYNRQEGAASSSGTVLIHNRAVSDPADPGYYQPMQEGTTIYDSEPLANHIWDYDTIQTRWAGTLRGGPFHDVEQIKVFHAQQGDLMPNDIGMPSPPPPDSYSRFYSNKNTLDIGCYPFYSDCDVSGSVTAVHKNYGPIHSQIRYATDVSSFWNPKEGRAINVIVIDLALLGFGDPDGVSGPLPPGAFWPSSGNNLLMTDMKGAWYQRIPQWPDHPNGILLINGRQLKDDLTVASSGPVFIQGDFNVGDVLPNNSNGTPAAGTVKKAAIIAESVYFLSDGFQTIPAHLDRLPPEPPGPPDNSPTTIVERVACCSTDCSPGSPVNDHLCRYNVAIVTGYQQAGVGAGNGENGGGFIEDWSNVRFKHVGSFAQPFPVWVSLSPLFGPTCGNDAVCGATNPLSAFRAPLQTTFEYDTSFNDWRNVPRFMPYYIEWEKFGFAN